MSFNIAKAISDSKPAAKQAAKKQTAPKNTGHVWFSPIRTILIDAAQELASLKYQTDAGGLLVDLGFEQLLKVNKIEDKTALAALERQAKVLKSRFSEYPETIKIIDGFIQGVKQEIAPKPAKPAKPAKTIKAEQETPPVKEEKEIAKA